MRVCVVVFLCTYTYANIHLRLLQCVSAYMYVCLCVNAFVYRCESSLNVRMCVCVHELIVCQCFYLLVCVLVYFSVYAQVSVCVFL